MLKIMFYFLFFEKEVIFGLFRYGGVDCFWYIICIVVKFVKILNRDYSFKKNIVCLFLVYMYKMVLNLYN